MIRKLVMGLAALVVGTGCVSMTSVQTADTLGAGNMQFALEPGAIGAASFTKDVEGGMAPHVDMALRYGVSDTVDVGLRIGSSLTELQTKFLLSDPANPSLALALAPTLQGVFLTSGDASLTYANLQVPLLVGFKTSGGSEFVLGPRVMDTIIFGSSGSNSETANIISVGASVGYAMRLGETFRIMPEVGVMIPLVGTVGGETSTVVDALNGGAFQFKLGFLFGGRKAVASAE